MKADNKLLNAAYTVWEFDREKPRSADRSATRPWRSDYARLLFLPRAGTLSGAP